MPTAEVEVLDIRKGYILTEFVVLHLRAMKDFVDFYGHKREAGQEWLVDNTMVDVHIIEADEELVQEKRLILLTKNQYCFIRHPVGEDGRNRYGEQVLKRGEAKFFLKPGEELFEGIKTIINVLEDEAILVLAKVLFYDKVTKKEYQPGQRWLITGPIDFVQSDYFLPDNEV